MTNFGYWLLVLVSVVLLVVLIDWWTHGIPFASIAGKSDSKTALETAQAMSQLQWDRISKLFDLLVLKGILPAFLTILGYLIGKKATS